MPIEASIRHLHVHVHVYMYMYMYMLLPRSIRLCVCTCTCMHVDVAVHVQVYMHTCIHMHMGTLPSLWTPLKCGHLHVHVPHVYTLAGFDSPKLKFDYIHIMNP